MADCMETGLRRRLAGVAGLAAGSARVDVHGHLGGDLRGLHLPLRTCVLARTAGARAHPGGPCRPRASGDGCLHLLGVPDYVDGGDGAAAFHHRDILYRVWGLSRDLHDLLSGGVSGLLSSHAGANRAASTLCSSGGRCPLITLEGGIFCQACLVSLLTVDRWVN